MCKKYHLYIHMTHSLWQPPIGIYRSRTPGLCCTWRRAWHRPQMLVSSTVGVCQSRERWLMAGLNTSLSCCGCLVRGVGGREGGREREREVRGRERQRSARLIVPNPHQKLTQSSSLPLLTSTLPFGPRRL